MDAKTDHGVVQRKTVRQSEDRRVQWDRPGKNKKQIFKPYKVDEARNKNIVIFYQ